MKPLPVVAAFALALSAPVAAFADADADAVGPQEKVTFELRALLRQTEVTRIQHRLEAAAHHVCTPPVSNELWARHIAGDCYQRALAEALKKLDAARAYAAANSTALPTG